MKEVCEQGGARGDSQERLEGGFALVEGWKRFARLDTPYLTAPGGCHDFRALIKEIRKGEINFCVPTPALLDRTSRSGDTAERETALLYCR